MLKNSLHLVLLLIAFLSPSALSYSFYDDFSDNDISNWEERGHPANWYAAGGMVHGSTTGHPSLLLASEGLPLQNGEISISTQGIHAFGICARLDEDDSGIVAYVSPDHDVARIRLIENGSQGTILGTLNHDFPGGVMYTLTLELDNDQLAFNIHVPSTGDNWLLTATDPAPHPGLFGFHMGDEPGAQWDWIDVEGMAVGDVEMTWLITDDAAEGNGNNCLEPGETIELAIELTNQSDSPLQNAFGILQSLNSELVVVNNYVTYGTIPGMGTTYGNSNYLVTAPLVTPEDETYSMRLTVMADGGYQKQILFYLPVGSGIDTDVEQGAEGWTWGTVSPGWENDWHVSSSRNHTPSGQYSFKCGSTGSGDYSNNHYGYLESPYFNIPLNGECVFLSWIDAQIMSSSTAFDGGIVQYRRLNEWIDLFPVPSYTHSIATGTTGPFAEGTQVFSGAYDWTEYTIEIPDSLAGPGAIRFVFGSDESGNREGWYIDDIEVAGSSSGTEGYSSAVEQPFLSVSSNPLGESVVFNCFLPGVALPRIEVRDISGRIVAELPAGPSQAGHSAVWETAGIPSGVYFASVPGSSVPPLKLVRF